MKTKQEIIIKTLITLRSYYSAIKTDIPVNRAIENLSNLNAVDTTVKLFTLTTILNIYLNRISFGYFIYRIRLLFTNNPVKPKIAYLSYLIKRLNKQEKYSNFLVYLFAYNIREYIYKDKHNRVFITDINNAHLMDIKDALILQEELASEETTIIICDTVFAKIN